VSCRACRTVRACKRLLRSVSALTRLRAMCPATAALFIATGLLQGTPDRTRFRCATCAKCARRAASIWFVRNRQIVRAFKKRRQRGRLRHPALKDKTYAKVCELALPMVPLVGWMMLQFHFWAPEAEFHCADRLHSAAWALILPSCFLGAPLPPFPDRAAWTDGALLLRQARASAACCRARHTTPSFT